MIDCTYGGAYMLLNLFIISICNYNELISVPMQNLGHYLELASTIYNSILELEAPYRQALEAGDAMKYNNIQYFALSSKSTYSYLYRISELTWLSNTVLGLFTLQSCKFCLCICWIWWSNAPIGSRFFRHGAPFFWHRNLSIVLTIASYSFWATLTKSTVNDVGKCATQPALLSHTQYHTE